MSSWRRRYLQMSLNERRSLSRRELIKLGLLVSGSTLLPLRIYGGGDDDDDDDDDGGGPPIQPFQRDLLVPPVHQPVSQFSFGPTEPQCSLTFPPPFENLPPPLLYEVRMKTGEQEIVPGTLTQIWGYNGQYPGPTFQVDRNQPIVVRFINDLDVETSIHNHGGHTAAASDGFPNDFVLPGEFKDYCYPNIAPDDETAEFATFQWYHDHAMDITGENVWMGLAGFYLLSDDLEKNLIDMGKLPENECDIPMVFQDRRFDSNGTLIYNSMDHDGALGNRFLVNGVIQPKFHVQRKKYRFRILNGSNARVYAFRLSTGKKFLQIGNDSWLLPQAVEVPYLLLAPAERADVIIDFRDAPSEVFLQNMLEQDDGTGPDEDIDEPEDWDLRFPIMKFVVDGPPINNATIEAGDELRPHIPILQSEIVKTRHWEFDREHGAWVINDRFFDPDRDDATPQLGSAERWIYENDSGGWVHPIHNHLEAHQIQRINGHAPPQAMAAKKDTVLLGDFSAEVFLKFRTFPGRFVFHCHNVEHEDMRMMGVFHVKE